MPLQEIGTLAQQSASLPTEEPEPIQDVSNLKIAGDTAKFYSTYHNFKFALPHIDSDGFETDANGNNKIKVYKFFEFEHIPKQAKNKERNMVKESHSIFVASRKVHGEYYDRIISRLTDIIKGDPTHFYTEDAWDKKENGAAYSMKMENRRILSENAKLKADLEAANKRIAKSEKSLSKG